MYNYKLVIQYDGTRYDGWQRMGKDESINTIEYKIAEIIFHFIRFLLLIKLEIDNLTSCMDTFFCPASAKYLDFLTRHLS